MPLCDAQTLYTMCKARALKPHGGIASLRLSFSDPPPTLVAAIPLYGVEQTGRKVYMHGLPTKLANKLGGIDGVTPIMTGSVMNPIEIVFRSPKCTEDLAQYR